MPVLIDELRSDVTVLEGDVPLSEAQIEKLIKIVLSRLDRKLRDTEQGREATQMRTQAAPASPVRE